MKTIMQRKHAVLLPALLLAAALTASCSNEPDTSSAVPDPASVPAATEADRARIRTIEEFDAACHGCPVLTSTKECRPLCNAGEYGGIAYGANKKGEMEKMNVCSCINANEEVVRSYKFKDGVVSDYTL